jgi:hypothetical protein
MELSTRELQGLLYGLELAVDDQEAYLFSDWPMTDYEADDLIQKADSLRACAEGCQRFGQTGLADRFNACADTSEMLAKSHREAGYDDDPMNILDTELGKKMLGPDVVAFGRSGIASEDLAAALATLKKCMDVDKH